MNAVKLAKRLGTLAFLMLSAFFHVHAAAKFDPLDPLGTVRQGRIAKDNALVIEVSPGNWGEAEVRDIQLLLDTVAAEFLAHIGPLDRTIQLRVVPRGGAPKVRYEKARDGRYVVQLTARDQRWFQYVFQFSHELCHVLSNFDHKEPIDGSERVDERNQWFEESLCETASLFTLRRLAVQWETSPPSRNWSGYGSTLSAYARHLMNEAHRHLPPGQSFHDWYEENKQVLSDNPYLREKNELVAANLLPLFEANPELWQSIRYLNPLKTSAGKSFALYLTDWRVASPDKTLPDQVFELFGLSPAGALAAH